MRLERFRFRAMGSPCELQLYGDSRKALDELAKRCTREIARLEVKYSRYREDSLASAINRSAGDGQGVVVDDETAALLDFAATAHRESGGPLMKVELLLPLKPSQHLLKRKNQLKPSMPKM